MRRRRVRDYVCVIKVLKSAAMGLNYNLDVEYVMIDFEIAAKIAFERLFPNCKAIGCLFHFGQSLFKKFAAIGLKTAYLENVDIQVWFKSIFFLALIPPGNVEQQFFILVNQLHYVLKPKHIILRSKGPEFVDYFKKNYLNQDARFPISMWNHWDNHDDGTNNRYMNEELLWRMLSSD
jgi:hypothetical protein